MPLLWLEGEARLTLCSDQASVVPDRTAVFKDEDCDGHNGQTHDEHHHPDRRTVRFYREREDTGQSQAGESVLRVSKMIFD